jgi:hypothetical protein
MERLPRIPWRWKAWKRVKLVTGVPVCRLVKGLEAGVSRIWLMKRPERGAAAPAMLLLRGEKKMP